MRIATVAILALAATSAWAAQQPNISTKRPTKGAILLNPGVIKGFNPQPDPPGRPTKGSVFINPGVLRGFNPQPDPPGVFHN